MTPPRTFPVFDAHDKTRCHRCQGLLRHWKPSLFTTGKWMGYCEKCDYWTYYDLAEEEEK